MAAPKSPVTAFHEAIRSSPLLKRARVEVFLGKDALSQTGAPRRLVLWPIPGNFVPPNVAARRNSAPPPLAELELLMVALIWAENYDEGWDILQRFFQAMHAYTAAGGPRYLPGTSDDTSGEDTSLQGETIGARFRLVLPIHRVDEQAVTVERVTATVTDDVDTQTVTVTG